MEKKFIVVGYDYSDTSKNALQYALDLASDSGHELMVVHLLDDEDNRVEREELLRLAVNSLENTNNIPVTSKVIGGHVETDITKVAETLDADVVVLGMNRSNLVENIFGSSTMRIVKNSRVPFLMVNQYVNYRPVRQIAVTITSDKESLQVLGSAQTLAKTVGAEIRLIGAHHTNNDRAMEVDTNMKIAMEYLIKVGAEHTGVFVKDEDYLFHLIEYCEEYGIDLIASTYVHENLELFSDKFIQKLMDHSTGIPVLTIESEDVGVSSNLFFMQ